MGQRRKRIAYVNFANGAKMAAYLLPVAHPTADPSDLIEVELRPSATSYGEEAAEPTGWYMNAYDVQNLVWMLSGVTLYAIEHNLPLKPDSMEPQ